MRALAATSQRARWCKGRVGGSGEKDGPLEVNEGGGRE